MSFYQLPSTEMHYVYSEQQNQTDTLHITSQEDILLCNATISVDVLLNPYDVQLSGWQCSFEEKNCLILST